MSGKTGINQDVSCAVGTVLERFPAGDFDYPWQGLVDRGPGRLGGLAKRLANRPSGHPRRCRRLPNAEPVEGAHARRRLPARVGLLREGAKVPAVAISHSPSFTQEQYDEVVCRLTGGKDRVQSPADWPVEGLLVHIAGQGATASALSTYGNPRTPSAALAKDLPLVAGGRRNPDTDPGGDRR